MKLTPAQTRAYDLALAGRHQFILFGGGIRGGKTWWLLACFVYLCSKYPRSRWAIIRKSEPVIKRNLLPTWQAFLDSGLSQHVAEYNGQTMTATFRNGSQLLFMAEAFKEDPELYRFRGLEVNGFGADELNELQQATFRKFLERAGTWYHAQGFPPPLVLGTCNPSDNWLKAEVYDRYVAGTLPATWCYLPALITDNPHVPPEYLESLRSNMLPQDFRRFVEGDWSAQRRQSLFADYFREEVHLSRAVQHDPRRPLIISVDFNLHPFAVTFAHAWRDERGLHDHTFDEAQIPNGSIPAMAELIRLRYGEHLRAAVLTGDRAGQARQLSQDDHASYYLQLQRLLRLRPSQVQVPPDPGHAASRADVNYLLWRAATPGTGVEVLVHPDRCPGLVRDLLSVQVDATGHLVKKDRRDLAQQADLLDSWRYRLNLCWRDYLDRHQRAWAGR